MTTEDTKLFLVTIRHKDEHGHVAETTIVQVGIRRQHVTSYSPSVRHENTTVVNTLDGKQVQVDMKFVEFHKWVMAPTLERDKRLQETRNTPRPGRPKKVKPETPETPAEETVGG